MKPLTSSNNNSRLLRPQGCSPLEVPFEPLGPGAKLPTRANPDDAGWDLYTSEDTLVKPGGLTDLPTGLRCATPSNLWCHLLPRSSTLPKWNLHVVPGVLDPGYRGELFLQVYPAYWVERPVWVPAGTRLGQLVFHLRPELEARWGTGPLPPGTRGDRGFGSSGK